MNFENLSVEDRIVYCHTLMLIHPEFSILGGVTQIGKVLVTTEVETACTNGKDVKYNPEFVMGMNQKQLLFLIAHENFHKTMHHCTEYKEVAKKYPQEFAMACDHVVNLTIEDMDPDFKFVERPTSIPPLVDPQFKGMSVLEVLRKLLTPPPPGEPPPPPKKTMDKHEEGEADEEVAQQLQDAVVQGEIISRQLRGEASAGNAVRASVQERSTNWRTHLRRFMMEHGEGDDQSRYAPPNKRLMPLDVLLPTHFSETCGELVIACDTSGSMLGVYPLVFGEIANLCKSLQPSKVRVLWWDTRIAGEQVFTPKDYDKIRALVKPKGGGGTTVSCVARHCTEHRLKPAATLMLTDGYIESRYECPKGPLLWGVVGNSRFRPLRGKVVHIDE